MSDWRFLDTGSGEAAWNMAVDELLAREVRAGRSRPVLRFYTWTHPAISCGYFQDIERELDLEACRQKGIEVVRRPTGGRAVYHGSDLTITLAARESEPKIGGDIGEIYRKIAQAIAHGLSASGLPVELVRSQASGREIMSTPSCFASKARYELVLKGRKIFGGAQRRWEGVVLSQGSLQLWGDGGIPPELVKKGRRHSGFEPKTPAHEAEVSSDRVKLGIRKGFMRVFGVDIFLKDLTPEEQTSAFKIAARYGLPSAKHKAPFSPDLPEPISQFRS